MRTGFLIYVTLIFTSFSTAKEDKINLVESAPDEKAIKQSFAGKFGAIRMIYSKDRRYLAFAHDDYLNRRVEKAVYEGEALRSKKRFIYNGYLQIAELDAMNASETVAPVLRKTYLWDPLEPIATRVLAMSVFDETSTYVEDLYYTHDALKNTTALFGIQARAAALFTNTAPMALRSRWKAMPRR